VEGEVGSRTHWRESRRKGEVVQDVMRCGKMMNVLWN
jgi:hypothetical protein